MARKFRAGQEVVIARNLGTKGGYGKNEYYYGWGLCDVPLHSKGKIKHVCDNSKIEVILENFGGWDVHPDELASPIYDFCDSLRKKVRKLERHPLFEMAEHAPVFVYNGKVYSLGENNGRDFFIRNVSKRELKLDKLLRENGISERRNKRGIIEISSLDSLDELALQRNEKSIEEIENWYFKNTLRYLGLEGSVDDNSIQQLIFSQVFPYFRDNGKKEDRIAKLLGDKIKTNDKKKLNKRTRINNDYLEQVVNNAFNDMKEIEKAVREDYEQANNLKNFISLN